VDKNEYGKREKVTMVIEAIDALDLPVAAYLSVAVTDADQAAAPQNETTILNSYPFSQRDAKASEAPKHKHDIQYGIPLSGKIIGKKKSQKKGEVRLLQNSNDVPLTLLTDEDGKFSHELQLMDSVELYMEAVTARGKPAVATIDSIQIPRPAFAPVAPLSVEFHIPTDQSKAHIPDALANARMLNAVTISESRIIPRKEKSFNVDVAVDNTWLRATLAIDLLSALQRRIPGLRIVYKTTPGGYPMKYIVFSGNFSFQGGAQEPLVVLDGIAVEPEEGSMAEKLSQITTAEVENVEVLKTGNAAMYGARGANGVIMVTTTRGRVEQAATHERDISKLKVVKLPGYSATTPFEAPDYAIRQTEDTDVRSTLYWNPDVHTTGKEPMALTFYTADLPGTYRIVVEGVTIDGSPVRAEKFINIR
jgi:TonB-dependent SusC/RagA subfamily outer membrane receptor